MSGKISSFWLASIRHQITDVSHLPYYASPLEHQMAMTSNRVQKSSSHCLINPM